MMLAVTAGGPPEAYSSQGYQRFAFRTFLTPLEQTARLCKMRFLAPYVLFDSIRAIDDGRIGPHAESYATLLSALRDDACDLSAAEARDVIEASSLPIRPVS
jgi:putative NADPH-quinone reductase